MEVLSTRTLPDGDLPYELYEDLLKTYKNVEVENYGKTTSTMIEKAAGRIAVDPNGKWEKRYKYKLVEQGTETCSLREIIETTVFKNT